MTPDAARPAQDSPSVAVVVVAAGNGTRLGHSFPKAFVELAGRSILSRSLDPVFLLESPVQLIVVAPPALLAEARTILDAASRSAAAHCTVVAGGDTRQASVAAGLAALAEGVDTVLVHDAARALAPVSLFRRVIRAVRDSGRGAIPGLAVSDTIKRVDAAATIRETVDRSELVAVQTPQGFPRGELVAAYAEATAEFTDDAALIAASGGSVAVVEGEASAFKITTPWDLRRAEQLLERVEPIAAAGGEPRVGIGVDSHAHDAARPLWLAGLHWPGEPGLAGHSDGDAVCHALCDALLSAAGLGDLGSVFGVDDPRYDGAHGEVFLSETVRMIRAAGFRVGNVAVQLVARRPRFAPRKAEAESLLSAVVGAPVSVSATTTDGLGFTGRGEGVAALVTAVLFPAAAGE